MAYKQKGGSPFHRNFGIGKSPLELNEVYIDGIPQGTGEEAMKLGKDAEKNKTEAIEALDQEPLQYINARGGGNAINEGTTTAAEILAQEKINAKNEQIANQKVTYTDQDAIDRINDSRGNFSSPITTEQLVDEDKRKKELLRKVNAGGAYSPHTGTNYYGYVEE